MNQIKEKQNYKLTNIQRKGFILFFYVDYPELRKKPNSHKLVCGQLPPPKGRGL